MKRRRLLLRNRYDPLYFVSVDEYKTSATATVVRNNSSYGYKAGYEFILFKDSWELINFTNYYKLCKQD